MCTFGGLVGLEQLYPTASDSRTNVDADTIALRLTCMAQSNGAGGSCWSAVQSTQVSRSLRVCDARGALFQCKLCYLQVSRRLIHITDWLPTFCEVAGCKLNGTKPIDGVSAWGAISNDLPSKLSPYLPHLATVWDYRLKVALGIEQYIKKALS